MLSEMKKHAERCADMIRSEALVVSHIDADGLTSAAIIATALEDAGIEYSTILLRSLLQRLKTLESNTVPFLKNNSEKTSFQKLPIQIHRL